MKAERVKTPETTEEVSSFQGEKGHWSQKNIRTPPVPEEKRGRTGKKACKSGRWEDNHKNGKKQFIYAMNHKSNGKSRVNTNVNSTGTNYAPPAEGSYSIVFNEGTNSVLGSNDLSMAHAGAQFKLGTTTDTDKLTISLSAHGVLTGHFVTNNDTKALQFKGAFFGPSQDERGSGFILDGGSQTGYFLLEPQETQ